LPGVLLPPQDQLQGLVDSSTSSALPIQQCSTTSDVNQRYSNPFALLDQDNPLECLLCHDAFDHACVTFDEHLPVPASDTCVPQSMSSQGLSWGQIQSAQLRSAAHGAGIRKKPAKRQNKTNQVPHVGTPGFASDDNHNVSAGSGATCDSAYVSTTASMDTECFAPTHHCDVDNRFRIKLQLSVTNDDITVALHCFDKSSHTVYTSDAPPKVMPPTSSSCKKVGKVRKKYLKHYFADFSESSISKDMFQEIFDAVTAYDGLNGYITPALHTWTDAFSDVKGSNSKCPRHWSVLDNAFMHSWHKTNIYAFPPANDELVLKTLQYHVIQQQHASLDGRSFRGIYVIPYKTTSMYWKYTRNFHMLKYYPSGTPFVHPTNKHKSISFSHPMCVLYDPGYTEPHILGAYSHALELCANMLDDSIDYLEDVWHITTPVPHPGHCVAPSTIVDDGGGGISANHT
jgi:hypothetical protein